MTVQWNKRHWRALDETVIVLFADWPYKSLKHIKCKWEKRFTISVQAASSIKHASNRVCLLYSFCTWRTFFLIRPEPLSFTLIFVHMLLCMIWDLYVFIEFNLFYFFCFYYKPCLKLGLLNYWLILWALMFFVNYSFTRLCFVLSSWYKTQHWANLFTFVMQELARITKTVEVWPEKLFSFSSTHKKVEVFLCSTVYKSIPHNSSCIPMHSWRTMSALKQLPLPTAFRVAGTFQIKRWPVTTTQTEICSNQPGKWWKHLSLQLTLP